jgi:hypothetical protein
MKIWVVINQHEAKSFVEDRDSLDFSSVKDAIASAKILASKIKTFVLSKGGYVFLETDFSLVAQVPHTSLEELENIIENYCGDSSRKVSVGLGVDFEDAKKAARKSQKTGCFEFYSKEDPFYKEDAKDKPEDQNNIADKKKVENFKAFLAPSIEESISNREEYLTAVAAKQAEKMAPLIQKQVQAQMEAQAQQQSQAQQQAQAQPQGDSQGQQSEEDVDPREMIIQGEPEKKSEDKIEMDPAKSEISFDDPKYKIAGLLATIRENASEFAKLRQQDPDGFAAVSKLISSAIKLAKAMEKNELDLLLKSEIDVDSVKKAVENSLAKSRLKKKSFPVGFVKDGKIKIKDPLTGAIRWRGVRTGLMADEDGAPISTKVYNSISRGNELGKDEPSVSVPNTFHSPKARRMVDEFAALKNTKIDHDQLRSVKVDPQKATKYAQAYHELKHDPSHPEVKASYKALIDETLEQFNYLKNKGLKFSKIKPDMANPYKSSKDMIRDIEENNHLWFFPTESGYGSSGESNQNHPMLTPTNVIYEGKPMVANDIFRIVHDVVGHAAGGHSFGPHGEERAYRTHRQLYSPAAAKALASETRLQNSFVNFGPHAEHNRKNPQNTIYADQKAALAPDWAVGD